MIGTGARLVGAAAAGLLAIAGGTLAVGSAAAACAAPRLEVVPERAPAGGTVTVTGIGWVTCDDVGTPDDPPGDSEPYEEVRLGFRQGGADIFGDDTGTPRGPEGRFTAELTVPDDAELGEAMVIGVAEDGGSGKTSIEVVDGRGGGRLFGADRIATSGVVSQRAFPEGAATAYLASSQVPFDAQVGATLDDGPILLVAPCAPLAPVVADELDRLRVTSVIVLGGPAAVADEVLEQAMAGRSRPTTSCPGNLPAAADGLALMVRPGGDGYEVVLTNARGAAVEGGVGYLLEQLAGVAFTPINDEVAVPAVARSYAPGESVIATFDADATPQNGGVAPLAPGAHRVRYPIDGIELAVEFAVP